MKNMYKIQNEFELKEKSIFVVKKIIEYGEKKESYFQYPRFQNVQSGLYDVHFKPIFTLITEDMNDFSTGYHVNGNHAYLIVPLPKYKYFDSSYLIMSNTISYTSIYIKIVAITILSIFLLFILSILFLNKFARPFEEINQSLDEFMKDSMHDINTTLNIINVNIDLYNRKHEKNKYLERIKSATKSLNNIYNDIDYIMKMEQSDFVYEKVDASKVLEASIIYFNEVANIKNITIDSKIEENIYMFFNATKLQRIIDNTLSNAIKYSHEGTSIETTLKKIDNKIVLIIRDYGIGIENTQRIFERHYRESSYKSGFGIGLNIVKSIIDKANIELKVVSKINEGSFFTYIFPEDLNYTDNITSQKQ